jgi:ribosomal protein L34
MAKHTLNGTRRKVIKTSGFRARLSTKVEEKILKKSSTSWTLEISNFQITFCFFPSIILG